MFAFHVAFSLTLLALTGGTALYVWSVRNKGTGSTLGKLIGLVVILISIASTVCMLTYSVNYWRQGYFRPEAMMQMQDMQMKTMGNAPKKMNHSRH